MHYTMNKKKVGKINTDELKQFIETVVKTIGDTTVIKDTKGPGKMFDAYTLSSPIDFELAVAIKKIGTGKISLIVAEIGGDYEQETISKIKFSFNNLANQVVDTMQKTRRR